MRGMSQDGISRFLYATKACAYFPFQAWFRENGIMASPLPITDAKQNGHITYSSAYFAKKNIYIFPKRCLPTSNDYTIFVQY